VNLDSRYKECDEKASKFLKKQTTEDRAEREAAILYFVIRIILVIPHQNTDFAKKSRLHLFLRASPQK
jgi:hypothetical protein